MLMRELRSLEGRQRCSQVPSFSPGRRPGQDPLFGFLPVLPSPVVWRPQRAVWLAQGPSDQVPRPTTRTKEDNLCLELQLLGRGWLHPAPLCTSPSQTHHFSVLFGFLSFDFSFPFHRLFLLFDYARSTPRRITHTHIQLITVEDPTTSHHADAILLCPRARRSRVDCQRKQRR